MTIDFNATANELERNVLEAVLKTVDTLVVVLDPQGRILRFNRACEATTGYTFAEVSGKTVWDCLSAPEEIESVRLVFRQLKEQGKASQHENYWVSKSGQRRLIAWSNTTLLDAHKVVEYIISTGIDITERRRNEVALQQQIRHEHLLRTIATHIHQSLDLKDILNTTVAQVRQVLNTDRVLIFRFQPNWSGTVLVESLGSGPWSSIFDLHIRDTCFAESHVERYRQGQINAVEDIHQANLQPCYLEFLSQFQVRANLTVPILQDDRLWGLLIAHHCAAPRQWYRYEVRLLTQLATQLAIAIRQSELYHQLQAELAEREQVEVVLQEVRKDLEQKVMKRTTELISVNEQLNLELLEHRETESALQVSQGRFAGILEIANDAIISVDTSQTITLFNQGAEQIFGYTLPEVLGQPLSLLLPEQFVQLHRQNVARFGQSTHLSKPMAERQEILARRKDGSEFPAEVSIAKLELGHEILYTVILRDISMRKQAQAKLEQLSHRNELILNAIDEGLCGLDRQARFTFVNAAAERYLGYPPGGLTGQPVEILFPKPSPPSPSPLSSIQASLKNGTIQKVSEATFCRRDQSCFLVEYQSTPILEQDKIVGAVITFKDISDRQVIKRMKDEFVSIVSHELRTPLTSIHGSLRMLTSGMLSDQPDKSQRLLKIAEDSTDRLVRLINDILDVERINSGKVEMVPTTCNAGNLMIQAANTMQGMADKMGVSLSVTPIAVPIWADPDRILQTLTNLLSNAIKFSEPGKTVWLKAQVAKLQSRNTRHFPICFSVRDQGRGIPEQKIDLIFEYFQQADSSDTRNHEGTGLGLSICRSIVQQHNGKIWVESQLGQGSTFYFTLPAPSTELSEK